MLHAIHSDIVALFRSSSMIPTFFQYTREKYVLSTSQSFRLTEWFKRRIVFVLIYEQSQVTEILPLGLLY